MPEIKFIERALDLMFPPRCVICPTILPYNGPRVVCESCEGLLETINNGCVRCGAPAENELCADCINKTAHGFLDGNRALFVYDDAVKRMIHNLKYLNRPDVARGLRGFLRRDEYSAFFSSADYFAFVPMHRGRASRRGYNQAELLAREASKITNIPLICALRRRRETKPQSGLDYVSRMSNLNGAFAACGNVDITMKNIIIIDDIYTTGATLNECAKVLKAEGAANVRGFTIAVAVKEM